MEANISNHIRNLCKLCRVCGNKVNICRGYKQAQLVHNYRELLYARFGVDIKDDDATVHPTRLCNKCYMKVYHVRNKDLGEVTQSIADVFNFNPHCEENCNVCRQYRHNKQQETSRANLSTTVVDDKNTLKESAKKHGFEVYSELEETSQTLFGQLEYRDTSIVVKKTLVLNADGTWHLKGNERQKKVSTFF